MRFLLALLALSLPFWAVAADPADFYGRFRGECKNSSRPGERIKTKFLVKRYYRENAVAVVEDNGEPYPWTHVFPAVNEGVKHERVRDEYGCSETVSQTKLRGDFLENKTLYKGYAGCGKNPTKVTEERSSLRRMSGGTIVFNMQTIYGGQKYFTFQCRLLLRQ